MLSYQHAYHAGGPADLHKHAALCAVLERLAEKEKPFVALDLYAGHGVYDLTSPESQKTGEFTAGIGRLWPLAKETPAAIAALAATVRALNPSEHLARYPGSPEIARRALRAGDRLIVNELHPAAYADLKRWAARDERIAVHKRDGLEALIALMPPPIRRGVVIVDPSYEIKSEYREIPAALREAHRKWKDGIYLIWYPILSDQRHEELLRGIADGINAQILVCELMFDPRKKNDETSGLVGTGLVVINPPWQFEQAIQDAGNWLARSLGAAGRHTVRSLKFPAA